MHKVIESIRLCCDRSVYLSLLASTIKYHVFCSLSINKNLRLSGSPVADATLPFIMDEGILWNRFECEGGSKDPARKEPVNLRDGSVAVWR